MKLPDIADIHDAQLVQRVQHKLDAKTKPQGSLGRIESLALHLAVILGTDEPALRQPQLVVFAGDHGLAARGVSAYPGEVTAQMVENFLAGGAAVSVLARQHGLALTVVDCGVRREIAARPGLVSRRIAAGTADASQQPAMTRSQCEQAIANGIGMVRDLPGNALLLGEMGIGNTSSASLLLARLADRPLEECVGAGTGLEGAALAHKQAVLREVLARHAQAIEPIDALAAFGSFEIATMVGAVLQAAAQRRVIVVDGFISTAAVLVAHRLAPFVTQRCVYSHRSSERGHAVMLRSLGKGRGEAVEPLLNLGLRLGEGSGAALAWPLLVSACALLREMASFESAGVSGRAEGA
jgi:nicotinate-nucleotide--dimethylbenzimidazole phosphoribosyltransferase